MGAVEHKITYKNHCTPQEYITENSRWYLDSDVNARLTGTAVVGFGTDEPSYASSTIAAAAVATIFPSGYTFIYVKNTGATGAGGINISFADEDENGSEADGYRIFLGPGECFASKIPTFASVTLKGITATTTYEYLRR